MWPPYDRRDYDRGVNLERPYRELDNKRKRREAKRALRKFF